jgi:DNA-directed RNA polymerase subunit M/transcription elongation factor TFIIS
MSREEKKKDANIENLANAGDTVTTFFCSKCDAEGSFWYETSERAYDQGWRATDRNVYCKKCAKKFKIK